MPLAGAHLSLSCEYETMLPVVGLVQYVRQVSSLGIQMPEKAAVGAQPDPGWSSTMVARGGLSVRVNNEGS